MIAFLAVGLATALGAGFTFRRATTPWSVLPDNDYWGNIRGLITETGLDINLSNLFRHNNEHIVAIPKLIYAANYILTSGNNIGLIVYSLFVGAACAVLLLILARDLLRNTPARWVLCAVLFPLAMFSGKLSHSYYFGMSGTIWLTADLLVILSVAALATAAKLRSTAWLIVSLLTGLIGVLTYSTAIYSLVVLIVFSGVMLGVPKFRGRFPWPALVGVALAALAAVIILVIHRPHPKGHPPLDFDPIGLAAFVLTYLGSAISNGYWQPVMGLAILIAGALSIRQLISEGRGADTLLWATLLLFAPFNSLMTGIGRLGFGLNAAMSSRYQSVTAISLIAAIALALAALPKEATSRRAARINGAAMGALALIALFLVLNNKTIKMYAKRIEAKPIAEIALRLGIAGDQHIRAATPAMDRIHRILPALRATHHVPFNAQSRCEAYMGERLASASGEPAGAIERMATYVVSREIHTAIELSGWAIQAGMPPECIAIVDGAGLVIGAGVAGSMHRATPDSRQVGWKAVAKYPQRMPVCAVALFPDSSAWSPLADCQATTN